MRTKQQFNDDTGEWEAVKVYTFSACWSEKLGQAINEASKDSFPIEAHRGSQDFQALEAAINQGIDSHLEAVQFTQGTGAHGRIRITIEPASVAVLVRRLMEDGDEHAESLASSICGCLNIELI